MNLSESLDRARTEATETTEKGQALAKEGFRELSSRVARVLDKVDGLGIDTFLRFAGLTRRSSSLMGAAGTFGAGLAVGAGLGILLAPSSGVITRRRISRYLGQQFSAIEGGAKEVVEEAKGAVEEPVQKVKEAARDLSDKAEKTYDKAAEKVESTYEKTAEAAAKTVDDMKTRVDGALHPNQNDNQAHVQNKNGTGNGARAHRVS